ncbi:hypothetical protein BBJ28_00020983 [Nothophytophthora sp. Chile5]|nr:hypothetical protein BBJ28_00020983 [Nothophytophthora sp. Chile5]
MADGHHIQLGLFLAPSAHTFHHQRDLDTEAAETCKPEILALLGVLDSLDLLDMFHASMEAVEVPSGIYQGVERIYHASSGKNAYVFTFDDRTGCPLAITQAPVGPLDASSSSSSDALQLTIEDYVRHDDSCIDAPLGIQSDVDLVLDAATSCFYQWTLAGRQQLEQIFALLDKDGDGSVSGQDLTDQLLDAGHSPERAQSIAMEMTRLLCDSTDPSEEVTFCRLAGFWVVMLADDLRVSDPRNERRVLPALEQLFLGPA